MRIVGGTLKGRRLQAPNQLPVRPTTDFAKEALFNILQQEVHWPHTVLVDLFAGIGSISFEAVSRGAKQVVAVESHYATVKWLAQTSESLQINHCFSAIKSDALQWLSKTDLQPNLIFADPPYEFPKYDELIALVKERFTGKDVLFVLEHRQNLTFDGHSEFEQSRSYGEVGFTFFRI